MFKKAVSVVGMAFLSYLIPIKQVGNKSSDEGSVVFYVVTRGIIKTY